MDIEAGNSTEARSCPAFFEDVVVTPRGELRVYRCEWGWYVRNGRREARSRYLDEAFETVLGSPLDHASVRAFVEMLDRELTAERDKTGRTASRVLAPPRRDAAGVFQDA